MLQHNSELAGKIRQLWDKFWAGGIANPLTAIEQITYLLFMKRLDELDLKKQSDVAFTGEPYTSRFEVAATIQNSPRRKTARILNK